MLELAQASQINPFIPGQPFNPQGAQAFLEQRGLKGISQGASNLINQLAGVGQVNAGTQMFLQPETEGDEGSATTQSAMLAALYKMAPTFAARFGNKVIGRAAENFFDQRRTNEANPLAAGQFSEENMIRAIRDQFGGSGIFG